MFLAVENVVTHSFRGSWMDYLNLLQSGFRPGYWTDMALVAILNDLWGTPISSTHPIRSGRMGMLWVPSAREYHLVGFRKRPLCCDACPVEYLPQEIRLSLTLLAFTASSKPVGTILHTKWHSSLPGSSYMSVYDYYVWNKFFKPSF